MNELLKFLCLLEKEGIHYYLEHNRDGFLMVHVAIPGERWEVEFSASGEVEIEIFKNSEGVFTDKKLLNEVFSSNGEAEFEIKISLFDYADKNGFIDKFVSEAIEANNLAVGGNPFTDGCCVSMYERGSVSEKTRQIVKEWIQKQPEVSSFWISELIENKA